MRPHGIMVALAAAGGMSPIEMGKIARLAVTLDAQVELFHCVDATTWPGGAPQRAERVIREGVRSRRQQLEALAGRIRMSGARVRTSVRWDHPAYAGIVRQVLRHKPSLLIASPTQRGRAKRFWLGRNDFRLIEACPCPVLFMKTRRPYTDAVVLAAVDPSHSFAKPAQLDEQIVRFGGTFATALGGALHAVYAYDPLPLAALASEVPLGEAAEAMEASAQARARKDFARALKGTRITPSRRHLVPRHPIDAIESTAREMDAGIVVMGAISRSGVKRLVLGNTAERVLDRLPCDVVVVKPRHFVSAVPRTRRGAQLVALSALQVGI